MLKKIGIVIGMILIFVSCNREIKLRKDSLATVPFKAEIKEGTHIVKYNKINYPNELEKKYKFYDTLIEKLKKIYISEKKYNFVISEEFRSDIKSLEIDGLLIGEELINNVASSLDDAQKKELIDSVGFRIEIYRGTVQEILNLQVYKILYYLGMKDKFEKEKLYTEKEKIELFYLIKDKRKDFKKVLEVFINNSIVSIDNPYENIKGKNNRYWANRKVFISEDNNLRKDWQLYDEPVFLTKVSKKFVSNLLSKNINLKNKVIFIETDYKGYNYDDGKFIFFVYGKKERYQFKEYIVDILIVDTTLDTLAESKYELKDIISN